MEGKIRGVGEVRTLVPVHPYLLDPGHPPPLQSVPEPADALPFVRHFEGHDPARLPQADDRRHILGPRPAPPFLPSPPQERMKAHPPPRVERRNPLGPVDLVSRERDQVKADTPNIQWDFSEGLHRIGVEKDSPFLQEDSDLIE